MLTNSLPTGDDRVLAHSGATSRYGARWDRAVASPGAPMNRSVRVPAVRSIIPRIRLALPKAALFLDHPEPRAKTQEPQRRFRSLFLSDTHLGAEGWRADRL